MASVPSGTVTLLFTDIEGSTRLWESHPTLMRAALERHDNLVRAAVEAAGGYVFKTVGDAFCVAFATAPQAVLGAIAAQSALDAEPWPQPLAIRARMGIHSGDCVQREHDYFGPTVNRAARLEATAHGGQIVLSAATRGLLGNPLPDGMRLRDLGDHRLKDLGAAEHVYQVETDTLPGEFPPLRSLENPALPNNLPRYTANFVGRDGELETVRNLVRGSRLVTLSGPGGVGKTRLALQVAADLLDGSGDGVWVVDLAPVTDEAMVPTAIADAIGLRIGDSVDTMDGLVDALADRHLLVVLDNCEHLIDTVATIADRLLRTCETVDLIATSREPLGINGEVVHRVPSLGLPEAFESDPNVVAQSEGGLLFVERARLHDPRFTIDATNAATVAAVCRRLDGIPLALELAAARLRSLSAPELLERLDQRFRLLTGGSRTAMARQQTLRATIDWSFELLSARGQTMLARTSVFAGGWDLSAAADVVSDAVEDDLDVFDTLSGLADRSLVTVAAGETTRYGLLETIREYAAEKLAAQGNEAHRALRRRHLDHYLGLAETAAPWLRGAEQKRWLNQLDADHDNFRAALVAAAELHDYEAGLRLCVALRWYAWVRNARPTSSGPWRIS